MRAVVIREHGDLDVLKLEDVPAPVAGPGEVVLDVRAVGLNHLDTWVRRGVPGHSFDLPMIPGCDFSGQVASVGAGVAHVKAGDAVCVNPGYACGECGECLAGRDNLCRFYGVYGEMCDGGCAEQVKVRARSVVPVPAGLDFVEAAAFPLTFLTAWHMLVTRCALRPSDVVLVHAAGSGVGSAAVQIAKFHGARVIATAGSDEKLARARELGADDTVNYESGDWPREVRSLTGKRGVDIVFEHVGASTWDGSVLCLATGGRLVTCGATTGADVSIDLRRLFFKRISLLGSTMGTAADFRTVVDLVSKGRLRPVVDRVLPLEAVAEGHAALGRREQFGKIVLTP